MIHFPFWNDPLFGHFGVRFYGKVPDRSSPHEFDRPREYPKLHPGEIQILQLYPSANSTSPVIQPSTGRFLRLDTNRKWHGAFLHLTNHRKLKSGKSSEPLNLHDFGTSSRYSHFLGFLNCGVLLKSASLGATPKRSISFRSHWAWNVQSGTVSDPKVLRFSRKTCWNICTIMF